MGTRGQRYASALDYRLRKKEEITTVLMQQARAGSDPTPLWAALTEEQRILKELESGLTDLRTAGVGAETDLTVAQTSAHSNITRAMIDARASLNIAQSDAAGEEQQRLESEINRTVQGLEGIGRQAHNRLRGALSDVEDGEATAGAFLGDAYDAWDEYYQAPFARAKTDLERLLITQDYARTVSTAAGSAGVDSSVGDKAAADKTGYDPDMFNSQGIAELRDVTEQHAIDVRTKPLERGVGGRVLGTGAGPILSGLNDDISGQQGRIAEQRARIEGLRSQITEAENKPIDLVDIERQAAIATTDIAGTKRGRRLLAEARGAAEQAPATPGKRYTGSLATQETLQKVGVLGPDGKFKTFEGLIKEAWGIPDLVGHSLANAFSTNDIQTDEQEIAASRELVALGNSVEPDAVDAQAIGEVLATNLVPGQRGRRPTESLAAIRGAMDATAGFAGEVAASRGAPQTGPPASSLPFGFLPEPTGMAAMPQASATPAPTPTPAVLQMPGLSIEGERRPVLQGPETTITASQIASQAGSTVPHVQAAHRAAVQRTATPREAALSELQVADARGVAAATTAFSDKKIETVEQYVDEVVKLVAAESGMSSYTKGRVLAQKATLIAVAKQADEMTPAQVETNLKTMFGDAYQKQDVKDLARAVFFALAERPPGS
jgi:hypothetical protein